MGNESGSGTTAAFSQALASLKRRGSNLLLVGNGGTEAQLAACSRLLGEGPDRRRLFVFTDRASSIDDRLPPVERGRESVWVVDCTSETRSAAAASTGASGGATRRAVPLDDLVALGEAVSEAVDALDGVAGGLDPAELRVCFDSLRPLLAEHDEQRVFRFLHALTGDVRGARGMGHYHLPVDYGSDAVRVLEPLFDAVVEVRIREGHAQQRWHLRDRDITTDWLPL